jgi:hypothetical protein
MRHLPDEIFKHPDNNFKTPSEVAATYEPLDVVDVPHVISWADTERDLSAWLGNPMQSNAIHELYRLEKRVKRANDARILADWRKLQVSDHFYYMCTKYFADGDVHKYFNPYDSPYDSYINFMNVLDHLQGRCEARDLRPCRRLGPVRRRVARAVTACVQVCGAGPGPRTLPVDCRVPTDPAKERASVPVTSSTAGERSVIAKGGAGEPEEIVRVATQGKKIDELLKKEWLLTNARGSFASSTIAGCHTSGYHGLLVGSPDPLVRRMMALSNCLEALLWHGQALELSTLVPDRFARKVHAAGVPPLPGLIFGIARGRWLCKSVYQPGRDTILVNIRSSSS